MIEITTDTIDLAKLHQAVRDDDCGAGVVFVGTTRRTTGSARTMQLEYEAYESMALREMQRLADTACQRWPLGRYALVHRVGPVPVGEASVAIAVSTPHRADAFEAAQWLIDQLKECVPIWKRETLETGREFWVHPEKNLHQA